MAEKFDEFSKHLAMKQTRRGVFKFVGAGLLSAFFGTVLTRGGAEADERDHYSWNQTTPNWNQTKPSWNQTKPKYDTRRHKQPVFNHTRPPKKSYEIEHKHGGLLHNLLSRFR